MASLLGTALSVGNGTSSSGQSNSEMLVDAYKKQQQTKLDSIKTKQTDLENKKVFYSNVQSKLSDLQTQIDNFSADDSLDLFQTRKAASSDTDVLDVTSTGGAAIGVSTFKVSRLASNDVFISKRFTLDNQFKQEAGEYSFKIGTEEDNATVKVKLNGDETYSQAISKIVTAINGNADIGVSAALVKDTSKTGRLTLTSKTTGSEAKIIFSDDTKKGLFDKLNIDDSTFTKKENRTKASASESGFKNTNSAELDSLFEVNGIEVTRSTNTPDDVLDGLTLKLKKTQASTDDPITVQTDVDVTTLSSNLQKFLDAYNNIVKTVKDNATIARSESSITTLTQNIRNIATQQVDSITGDDPKYLTDLGIRIKSDGSLYISDKDLLEEVATKDSKLIYNVFLAKDGIVNSLSDAIKNYTASDGIIAKKSSSLSVSIKDAKDKYQKTSDKIDKEAESLRKEYESMQKVYLQAQSQYSSFSSLQSSYQ